jgi:predicted alpha/beta-hydrolase family hydrolase
VVSERTHAVDVPGAGAVTAIESAAGAEVIGWTFIYAPGAGSNVHDVFGTFACRALAECGVRGVRFQFPYQEAKRRSPDHAPVLEATWCAVVEAVRDESRLVIGGRSMGGRIGSQVVAQGVAVDALALFAYPLHPPGKPEQRRDAHLSSIGVPTFFCSGTNDAFASPDELQEAAALIPVATVHHLEGADHGFAVRKATGRSREDVWNEGVDAMWEWLSQLSR